MRLTFTNPIHQSSLRFAGLGKRKQEDDDPDDPNELAGKLRRISISDTKKASDAERARTRNRYARNLNRAFWPEHVADTLVIGAGKKRDTEKSRKGYISEAGLQNIFPCSAKKQFPGYADVNLITVRMSDDRDGHLRYIDRRLGLPIGKDGQPDLTSEPELLSDRNVRITFNRYLNKPVPNEEDRTLLDWQNLASQAEHRVKVLSEGLKRFKERPGLFDLTNCSGEKTENDPWVTTYKSRFTVPAPETNFYPNVEAAKNKVRMFDAQVDKLEKQFKDLGEQPIKIKTGSEPIRRRKAPEIAGDFIRLMRERRKSRKNLERDLNELA